MTKWLIGLDFGTDSVRALLVSANGEEIASHSHAYRRWGEGKYCDAGASRFRQHPLDYLESMEAAVKGVLKGRDGAKVAGIGVDTTGSTPCAIAADGTPLALLPEFRDNPDAMFVLWKDHTAIREAEEINRAAKSWGGTDFTLYSGGIYSSEWFWAKILRVCRSDEGVRKAAFSWAEHCDWLTAHLTGNRQPATWRRSRCAAGHKAMWHPSWGGLPDEAFLAGIDPLLAGLRARLYTDTHTADVPAGRLSPEWAGKLGLSGNAVVSGGAFDAHVGAVGASIQPYQLVKVVGTSTCDILVAPEVKTRVRGICGQVEGSVIPGLTGMEAGQSAFGDVYAWFRRLLSYAGNAELAQLERDAAAVENTPVLALDWLNGRRTPDANPNLSGALFGLTLGTTAPMIYRALVEGTAFGSKRIAERFRSEGVPVRDVVAIGGIAKKSPLVMQILADVLEVPIQTLASGETCALGAAMFGAVAAGVYGTAEEAMAGMRTRTAETFAPDAGKSRLYREKYARYLAYADAVEAQA